MAITPYYFSLIKKFDYSDPVFSMCVPNIKELHNPSFLKNDPLNEEEDTVVDGLVHRYQDRALIISTSQCAMYCRFCTRKRIAGSSTYYLSDCQLNKIIDYLKSHPEIKDVIISGGDAFTMSNSKLENIISKVRSVESVDIIRIGTRTPVVMPQRITNELVDMLNKYHPLFVNTHFNHPNEITEESKNACLKMINKGIPVNNQSVLLKGINDEPETMIELCRNLLKIRVRPYYLFICDLVKGVEHFRTSINTGVKIMDRLRGRVSGLGIPQLILDSPEGKGKIPILPT
jgi:lysine 2,3-aminomutase